MRRRFAHGFAQRVLLEFPHVADDAHARASVQRLLDCFGQRDVYDEELWDREAVLVIDSLFHVLAKLLGEFAVLRGQIECGDLLLGEHVGKGGCNDRPHQFGDFVRFDDSVGANEFRQQSLRFDRFQRVGAEGAQADRAKLGVSQHDRVGRAPLQVRDLPRADEIDFGLERAVEAKLPAGQRAEDRKVLRVERVRPRLEHVGDFALQHEDRQLAGSHDELRSLLDLVLIARKPPDERVARVIEPLDDVDQFAAKLVEQSHDSGSLWRNE